MSKLRAVHTKPDRLEAPIGRSRGQRVRLPAEHRSPMLARRLVRSALHEAGLVGLTEDALLLTSELCENAVLHAGTEFELELTVSDSEITVSVQDFGPTAME